MYFWIAVLGGRAQRVEDQQHLVAFDELARLFHRFGRRVGVVIGDEIDLAAVDAAFGVDLAEVGLLGLADHAVGGGGSAVGHDVADLDLGVGCAGIVFLLRGCCRGKSGSQHEGSREGPQSHMHCRHLDLPGKV
ncbi:hypothetical protein ACVIHB_006574 [Bradyrhizobium liaoningense]